VVKFEVKFEDVWMAISPKGMSHIYIRPSGLEVNQEVYLNECITRG
jgi:hypothetical protein